MLQNSCKKVLDFWSKTGHKYLWSEASGGEPSDIRSQYKFLVLTLGFLSFSRGGDFFVIKSNYRRRLAAED